MRSQSDSPRPNLSELIAPPASPSAWLLAGALFFACMPAIEIAGMQVCFVLFAAAVFAGCLERIVRHEQQTGPALRRAAAAYIAAAVLLSLSYLVNAVGPLTQMVEPLVIRGQGDVPVLPVDFMNFIWGQLGAQEPLFLKLMVAAVVIPIVTLAVRIKSWQEFRFILLAWALGGVCGAVFVIAYCNGLIPGRVEYSWVYLDRAHGLNFHPNVLGINSLLATLPLVMLWWECHSRWIRAAVAVSAVLLWLAIDYSGSRSAVGGLFMAVAMSVLARASSWPELKRATLLVAAMSAGGAVLLFGVLPWLQFQPMASLQRLVQGSYGSDLARDIISRVIGDELWKSPIFGAGYHVLMVAHNIYVQLLHAAGVVGLIGLLLTLATPVVLLRGASASAPGQAVRAVLSGGVVTVIALYWVQSNPAYFGNALLLALAVYAALAHRTTTAFDPLADAPDEGAVAPVQAPPTRA